MYVCFYVSNHCTYICCGENQTIIFTFELLQMNTYFHIFSCYIIKKKSVKS